MPGSKHRCIVQFIARRMHTRAVAQPHAALRLVEGKVIFYTSLKVRRHRGSVHGKGPGGVGVQPAALILQCLGQVPVVERHIRLDARRQQRVHKPVVPGKASRVHRAGACRENARPGDGKPVGLQVQGFHQLHILGPAVVAVAGDVAGVAALGLARRMAEGIPDGRPTPVLKRAALYLIGCGSRTPNKFLWKWHILLPLVADKNEDVGVRDVPHTYLHNQKRCSALPLHLCLVLVYPLTLPNATPRTIYFERSR